MATILDLLRAEGLTVQPDPNWQTNVNKGTFRPEAVLLHWDAVRSHPKSNDLYIFDNRYGGVLYHAVIQPDGTVRLISDGYVWNAGQGDPAILDHIRSGSDVIPNPRDSGDTYPRINGNPFFYGVCIQYHPDYDGDVPQVQADALLRVAKVYLARHGWDERRLLHHRTWTRRKSDIRTLNLAAQRADMAKQLEADMAVFGDVPENHWAYREIEWMAEVGLTKGTGTVDGKPAYKPEDPVTRAQMAAFLKRFHDRFVSQG